MSAIKNQKFTAAKNAKTKVVVYLNYLKDQSKVNRGPQNLFNIPTIQQKLKYFMWILIYMSILFFFYFKFTSGISDNKKIENFSLQNFPKSFKLENIVSDDEHLMDPKVKKIFFIETNIDPERRLNETRQACSVESAARLNPDIEVYFIFVTNSTGVTVEYSELLLILSKYSNIKFRFLNQHDFSRGTFMEEFFGKDMLSDSQFHVANRANVLRILLLSRYGGQYLDLDVISLVPLSKINITNYGCAQSTGIVNNAVLNFDVDRGQSLLREYGRYLINEFQPNAWGANGPTLFSKVLGTYCNGTILNENSTSICGNFTVLPKSKCYEIAYFEFYKLYEKEFFNESMSRIDESSSYFVHFWNKMIFFSQRDYKIKADSKIVYIDLAKKYCPKVFESIDKYF